MGRDSDPARRRHRAMYSDLLWFDPFRCGSGSDQYNLTLHSGQHEYLYGAPLNTAVITAIPEPVTFGYIAIATGLVLASRQKRSARRGP